MCVCTSKCSIRRGCWLAASRVSSLIAFLHPFLIKQQNDLEMCFQLEIFIWRVKKKSAAFTTIIRSTINIVMCYNTNLIQAAIYTYMYIVCTENTYAKHSFQSYISLRQRCHPKIYIEQNNIFI